MTETELTITREEGPTHGRYVISLAPGYEAEMTFRKAANGTITIDHTGVPPSSVSEVHARSKSSVSSAASMVPPASSA